jgi:ubiquitin-activating enzyme E1 C
METGDCQLEIVEHKMESLSHWRTKDTLQGLRVLVAGAGALGCEVLRTLALHGIREITVIDMDVIEESNLNRQTLFSVEDIGQSKALKAAAAIRHRFPDSQAVGYYTAIQSMPLNFYRSFHVIVSGLDSVEARRWLNSCVFHIARQNDARVRLRTRYLPVLIDGGTEGFAGQVRTIHPYETACVECAIDLYANDEAHFPLCTVAGVPREPEHCVEYAATVLWPTMRGKLDDSVDVHDSEHVEWVFAKARERAEQFGISGVTIPLVRQVLERSVPAVAMTNAFVGAACALEVVKLVGNFAEPVGTWLAYNGFSGIYVQRLQIERRHTCPICGPDTSATIALPKHTLLKELIEYLETHPDLQCQKPSLVWAYQPIYMSSPRSLEEATRKNLDRPLNEILANDERGQDSTEFILTLTDHELGISREIRLILYSTPESIGKARSDVFRTPRR